MESWLADMANMGFFLCHEGFFAGFGIFVKSKPRAVRYRLEAAPKKITLWSDDGGAPEDEALEINAAYGWEYVSAWGQFYIYRSESSESRELNTDPLVQALELDMVRKRLRRNLFSTAIWLLAYPVIMLCGKLLLTAISSGSEIILLAMALILWVLYLSALSVVRLRKVRMKLSSGILPDHGKDWKRKSLRYKISRFLSLALGIAWIVYALIQWNNSAINTNELQLADYTGTFPFATAADLAAGGRFIMNPGSLGNTVTLDSDLLAPTIITLQQTGTFNLPGGGSASGGIYVNYYETAAPWLARETARELSADDRRTTHYHELQLPALDVDYTVAYMTYFPTLIVQDGCKVMRVTFFQNSEDSIPIDIWTKVFTDSIKRP
jgi:hypothetical protein